MINELSSNSYAKFGNDRNAETVNTMQEGDYKQKMMHKKSQDNRKMPSKVNNLHNPANKGINKGINAKSKFDCGKENFNVKAFNL